MQMSRNEQKKNRLNNKKKQQLSEARRLLIVTIMPQPTINNEKLDSHSFSHHTFSKKKLLLTIVH